MLRLLVCIAVLTLAWSCTPPSPVDPDDAGAQTGDSGSNGDAGGDAGSYADAGRDAGEASDAGSRSGADAGEAVPLAGFGAITGACGPLAHADLLAPSPATFETVIDFATLPFDAGALSDGGRRMYATGNLGGSSLESEVFAFEVLHRCEHAELVATEGEVTYSTSMTKRTDLVVDLEGERVGVSVARAFKFPPGTPLPVADAKTLLTGKFSDILVSSANVTPPFVWRKQILHVIAYDDTARAAVIQAAGQIDAGVRADTILYITRTDGNDAFIY